MFLKLSTIEENNFIGIEAGSLDNEGIIELSSSGDGFIDSDNDGLSDDEEINIHKTDPNNPDTDSDGYSDKQEIDGGYDPLN